MADALADTSVFVARETGRPIRLEGLPDRMAVSMITIGELLAGVLTAPNLASRDLRLATLLEVSRLTAIPVDHAVAEAWARLRATLRDRGLRLEINDSWIAATAMALGLPLVTQDADYIAIPGLEVIHV